MGGGGGGFFQHRANESQPVEKKADSSSAVSGNDSVGALAQVREKATPVQSSQKEAAPVVPVEDVLGDVVPVDFDGTSIRDVLESLARQKKFEVIYNRKAAVLDQSITLKSRQMTIEEILDEMLPPCDLEWNVKGSVLLVGSVEEMDVKLERRNYDVSKLLESVDSNTLIKVVTQTISPGDWQEVGGSSSVKCLDTQLVVYATQRTHREVKRFLAEAEVKRDASLDNGKRDPEELVLQVYRVPAENPEKLETMVRNLFEVDFRDRVNTALFTFEGKLIVRQARRVQREIGRLLELLRDPSAKNISCGGCWKGDGQFFTTTK